MRKKHLIYVLLLTLLLGFTANPMPANAQTPLQCTDLELETTSAIPGTIVYINIPPSAELVSINYTPEGTTEPQAVTLLTDEDGLYYFIAPNHPPELNLSDSFPVTLEIEVDGQQCEVGFTGGGRSCTASKTEQLISDMQTLIELQAIRYGYSANDLYTLSAESVPSYVGALIEAQYFIDHPNNPNSMWKILDGTSAISDQISVDIELMDCLMTESDLNVIMQESIAYFGALEPITAQVLDLSRMGRPAGQEDLTPTQIQELVQDQVHAEEQVEKLNSPALDLANSVAGFGSPIQAGTSIVISYIRAFTVNKYAKERDTLPAKVRRFNASASPAGPLNEDYSSTTSVNSAVLILDSNGYSDTDFFISVGLTTAGTFSFGAAGSKILSIVGTGAGSIDTARNVAAVIGEAITPPAKASVQTWAISFSDNDISEFLDIFPNPDSFSGRRVLQTSSTDASAFEVVGHGTARLTVRLKVGAFGQLSAEKTIAVEVKRIEVYIEETSRIELDDEVIVNLRGTIRNADNSPQTWRWSGAMTGSRDNNDPLQSDANSDYVTTLQLTVPRPVGTAWTDCEPPADSKSTVNIELESTTMMGARRPLYRDSARKATLPIEISAQNGRPPECRTPTLTAMPTLTPTPQPTRTPRPAELADDWYVKSLGLENPCNAPIDWSVATNDIIDSAGVANASIDGPIKVDIVANNRIVFYLDDMYGLASHVWPTQVALAAGNDTYVSQYGGAIARPPHTWYVAIEDEDTLLGWWQIDGPDGCLYRVYFVILRGFEPPANDDLSWTEYFLPIE